VNSQYPLKANPSRGCRRESLLTGLTELAVFPIDGSSMEVADAARRVPLNVSTNASTLHAVGLLEREPSTRCYWRAL
jgi:hypothetical protein